VWLLWLRAVRAALDLFCVQQTVVPAASLGHITIRYKQQLLLQERCLTELLSKFHRRIRKRRKLTKKKGPDIVRRQTDERHKAMFEIFTAVSKLK